MNEVYNISKLFIIPRQHIVDYKEQKKIYNKRYRLLCARFEPIKKIGRPPKYTEEERKEILKKRAREGMAKLRANRKEKNE
jgi:hypothetical protein